MYVSKEEIIFAHEKANEVREIHKLNFIGHDHPIKSVDDLLIICSQYLEKIITCKEHILNHDGQPIKGFFLGYEDRYEIVTLSGLNMCWKRLVKAKELFHVVMDKEEYRSPIVSDLIEQCILSFPDDKSHPKKPIAAEILAEIAAMQYLLPYSDREILINEYAKSGKNPDFMKIAEKFKIPRIIIEKYLSKNWMEFLAEFN